MGKPVSNHRARHTHKTELRKAIKNASTFAIEQGRIAERNLKALQNAIIANANMQQILQHEMCVCSHGGTHHWQDTKDHLCDVQGCTCSGWRSLWRNAFEPWLEEIKKVIEDEKEIMESEQANSQDKTPYIPVNLAEIPQDVLEFWFNSSKKPPQIPELIRERQLNLAKEAQEQQQAPAETPALRVAGPDDLTEKDDATPTA